MARLTMVEFHLEKIEVDYDFHSGFTYLYPVIVSEVSENLAREILKENEELFKDFSTELASQQVELIKNDENLLSKMIQESVDADGDSLEEARRKILDKEFWIGQVDINLMEFKKIEKKS